MQSDIIECGLEQSSCLQPLLIVAVTRYSLLQENTFQRKAIPPPLSSMVIAYSPLRCDHSFVLSKCRVILLTECRCCIFELSIIFLGVFSLSPHSLSVSLILLPLKFSFTSKFYFFTRVWSESKVLWHSFKKKIGNFTWSTFLYKANNPVSQFCILSI